MNTIAIISISITLFYWALGTAVMMSLYSRNAEKGDRDYIPVHWTVAVISGILSMFVLVSLFFHYVIPTT